jgi:hypothetical protein
MQFPPSFCYILCSIYHIFCSKFVLLLFKCMFFHYVPAPNRTGNLINLLSFLKKKYLISSPSSVCLPAYTSLATSFQLSSRPDFKEISNWKHAIVEHPDYVRVFSNFLHSVLTAWRKHKTIGLKWHQFRLI